MAIAEQGSLRAAARHLQLAQPALTRSLGELERELGASLFERQARGMVLTPVGRAFVKRATIVLNEVRRARDEVDQLHGGVAGSVAVGLSMAAHIALLPKTLRPFRARFPNVQLHIIEGFYPTLEADLRRGSIDFYIGPEPEQDVPPELTEQNLFSNTRTVLCRKGHPLGASRSLKELVTGEWATTSITLRAEKEFSELFEQHGLEPPRIVLRSQSALTLLVSLTCSDLLAMVPIQWTEFEPTADMLATIRIREQLPAPSIVLIRRSGVPLTPAALFLVDLMERAVTTMDKKLGLPT